MSDKQILKTIGKNLQKARQQTGLTQECLAEMADIHWKTLGYIETGRRAASLTTFVKLIQCLRIDPNHILRNLPAPNPKRLQSIAKALPRRRRIAG